MALRWRIPTVAAALLAAAACSDKDSSQQTPPAPTGNGTDPNAAPPAPVADSDAFGTWRVVLKSPGGDLPFGLRIIKRTDGVMLGTVINGKERIGDLPVTIEGNVVTVSFPHYDSKLTATLEGAASMKGEWVKTLPDRQMKMSLTGRKGLMYRFEPTPKNKGDGPNSINGPWKVTITDKDGSTDTRAEFKLRPMTLTGTFLTPTGDYRYLAGDYNNSTMRLSAFDGSHAFLFIATFDKTAKMTGDFWSGDKYHATFTGRKLLRGVTFLPDPFDQVKVKSRDKKFRFEFVDHATGEKVNQSDKRFKGKVLLVDIFGSWCPNCNDMAPVLVQLKRKFADQGLEVVGLAFEYTGDEKRDREVLKKFVARHQINYPVLLAGVSDKAKATAALPDISEVKAYPTTLFIDRKGVVRRVHSGFAGPGTGEHHTKLLVEMTKTVTDLLEEK